MMAALSTRVSPLSRTRAGMRPRGLAARTSERLERLVGDRRQTAGTHLEVDTLHPEQPVILLDERVLRLGQDADQRVLVELFEGSDHRQAADELRDQPVLDQVLGLDSLQRVADVLGILEAAHFGAEADAGALRTLADDLFQSVERAAADEEYVRRVDLDEVLVRVLAAALRWDRCVRPLDQLEERLLNPFARHVARYRRVVALARDLVDRHVDDPTLRLVDVVVTVLQQLLDHVLDVLSDVTGLGERRGVGDDERHVQEPGECLREQRLARTRRGPTSRMFDFADLSLFDRCLRRL